MNLGSCLSLWWSVGLCRAAKVSSRLLILSEVCYLAAIDFSSPRPGMLVTCGSRRFPWIWNYHYYIHFFYFEIGEGLWPESLRPFVFGNSRNWSAVACIRDDQDVRQLNIWDRSKWLTVSIFRRQGCHDSAQAISLLGADMQYYEHQLGLRAARSCDGRPCRQSLGAHQAGVSILREHHQPGRIWAVAFQVSRVPPGSTPQSVASSLLIKWGALLNMIHSISLNRLGALKRMLISIPGGPFFG